jgi:hypothetical protein
MRMKFVGNECGKSCAFQSKHQAPGTGKQLDASWNFFAIFGCALCLNHFNRIIQFLVRFASWRFNLATVATVGFPDIGLQGFAPKLAP